MQAMNYVSDRLCETQDVRAGGYGISVQPRSSLILWHPGEPPASFARFATGK
jgi:hypothetical protein